MPKKGKKSPPRPKAPATPRARRAARRQAEESESEESSGEESRTPSPRATRATTARATSAPGGASATSPAPSTSGTSAASGSAAPLTGQAAALAELGRKKQPILAEQAEQDKLLLQGQGTPQPRLPRIPRLPSAAASTPTTTAGYAPPPQDSPGFVPVTVGSGYTPRPPITPAIRRSGSTEARRQLIQQQYAEGSEQGQPTASTSKEQPMTSSSKQSSEVAEKEWTYKVPTIHNPDLEVRRKDRRPKRMESCATHFGPGEVFQTLWRSMRYAYAKPALGPRISPRG